MKALNRPDTATALSFCFEQLLRGGLRGVWLRGRMPPGPFVWSANHHSWWDGFVANAVLRRAGHVPALLMDARNLEQFAFLKRSGAIPADRPRAALAALDAGRTVIIFPEGELRAAGPLGAVAPGAAWLARKAAVPLVAAAARVVLRGYQTAEAYVDLTVCTGRDLHRELATRLQVLDAELADGDPREPLPGFTRVLTGRPSWDERITRWTAAVHR